MSETPTTPAPTITQETPAPATPQPTPPAPIVKRQGQGSCTAFGAEHGNTPQRNTTGKTSHPNVGKNLMQRVNTLSDRGHTRPELRAMASSNRLDHRTNAAAIVLLRLSEYVDLADFDEYLEGTKTLKQLREMGINTDAVKKAKTTKRTITQANGDVITTIEREVQLRDTVGGWIDRALNRTEGLPTHRVEFDGSLDIRQIQVLFAGDAEFKKHARDARCPGFVREPRGNAGGLPDGGEKCDSAPGGSVSNPLDAG